MNQTARQRYRVKFPPADANQLAQDEVIFQLIENGLPVTLRFHDYAEIYKRPRPLRTALLR